MKNQLVVILILSVFSINHLLAQDTIAGWTFPSGKLKPLADCGNSYNKDGMYLEAAGYDEISFGTVNLTSDGITTKCGSVSGWNNGSLKKAWKISVNAGAYESMVLHANISSDSLNPGPRDFKAQYRTGCCDPTWRDIPGAIVKAGTNWNNSSITPIQLPSACDNMIGLQLRFILISDTSTTGVVVQPTGVSLIDNVFVTGKSLIDISEVTRNTFKVYPNPSNGILYIQFTNKLQKIVVSNNLGEIVMIKDKPVLNEPLNLSSFPKGIYLLQLFDDTKIIPVKVILN